MPTIETVRAAATPTVKVPQGKITPIADFRAMDEKTLLSRAKKANANSASVEIEIGKMLVVMNDLRGAKGTLQSYVRSKVGELSSSAYKAGNAFGMVGEGAGFVAESDFDGCPLRWLIVVSSILTLLGKDPLKNDDLLIAATREEVAVIMRTRPADGHTGLKNIRKCLTPEKDSHEAESEGIAENAGEGTAGEKFPLLSAGMLKALKGALELCTSAETLTMMVNGFGALQAIAQGQLEELAPLAAAA